MTTVIYNPNKEIAPRRGEMRFGFCKLEPGNNNIKPEHLKQLKTLSVFLERVKTGIVTIIEDGQEPERPTDLSRITAEEAFKVIGCETSIKTLNEWHEQETRSNNRKTVVNAIQKHIRKIQDGNL